MILAKRIIATVSGMILAACGGGSGSSVPATSSAAPAPVSVAPAVTTVTISGTVTYDHIPHKTQSRGLNYGAMSQEPARGVVVALLDNQGKIIKQTTTNEVGKYRFTVDASTDFRVQAQARLRKTVSSIWDVKVTDNTAGNALYVMQGALKSSGDKSSQTRNLHAPSGWDGNDYTKVRVAAPFAILSPVYEAIMTVNAVDPKAAFKPLEFRWSPDNTTISGDKSAGEIGTSGFYKNENAIYLLGEAGRDTDEYDPHVILHEWGHYFEHNLSRLDSIGGLHGLNDKLDPRLAFSEGWGNALAAMITGDPVYKDSSGALQASGFSIDFENITPSRAGWYNEGSIAAILYDVFDTPSDGNDHINAGFEPIYKTMTHDDVKASDLFTTIFTFSDVILEQGDINSNDYQLLLTDQAIFSSNAMAEGENNSGAITSALPVYKEAKVGGGSIEVCSVDDAGNYNKLGNREFVFLKIEAAGEYEFSARLISDDSISHVRDSDPDFNIWQNGGIISEASSSVNNEEILIASLNAGNYILETYDFHNINGASAQRGDVCFEMSISATTTG